MIIHTTMIDSNIHIEKYIIHDEIKDCVNPNQTLKLISFDHFYKNPQFVRKYALQQHYHFDTIHQTYYSENNSVPQAHAIIQKMFEPILGNISFHPTSGRFLYNTKNQPLSIHALEPNYWKAIVYLTPDANIDSGIALYRNASNSNKNYEKNTQLYEYNDTWKLEDSIGNIYNRIVIFNASCFHRFTNSYGVDLYNSNLYQEFLFVTTKPNIT
jgi:hypothetical protein